MNLRRAWRKGSEKSAVSMRARRGRRDFWARARARIVSWRARSFSSGAGVFGDDLIGFFGRTGVFWAARRDLFWRASIEELSLVEMSWR